VQAVLAIPGLGTPNYGDAAKVLMQNAAGVPFSSGNRNRSASGRGLGFGRLARGYRLAILERAPHHPTLTCGEAGLEECV
jgi:hypothetical protein